MATHRKIGTGNVLDGVKITQEGSPFSLSRKSEAASAHTAQTKTERKTNKTAEERPDATPKVDQSPEPAHAKIDKDEVAKETESRRQKTAGTGNVLDGVKITQEGSPFSLSGKPTKA